MRNKYFDYAFRLVARQKPNYFAKKSAPLVPTHPFHKLPLSRCCAAGLVL